MDRDENAARNILVKALQGTLGHRETQEPVSSNAWGEMTSTAVFERVQGQASSRNQEPPAFDAGECQLEESESASRTPALNAEVWKTVEPF